MEDILEKLVKGDYKAFEKFYLLNKDVIYNYALKHCKDSIISKDIVQEVFIRFWNKIPNIDHNQNIQAYLFTIAKNLVFEEFRKKSLNQKFESYQLKLNQENFGYNNGDSYDFKELESIYHEAIEYLPKKRKEIYELSKLRNMSNQEISEYLNISSNTVRDQLVKAGKSIKIFIRKKFLFFI